MNELRHIKCVCIPAPTLERLVREGTVMRCVQGIPLDAKLVGMDRDVARDGIVLAFEHPSFPAVDAYEVPPIEWVRLEEVKLLRLPSYALEDTVLSWRNDDPPSTE